MVKILRSKKGISPILATLLLIVIAVAAITITYAWVMTFLGGTTGQAGVILYKENVRFYGVPSTAKNRTEIVIGNSGIEDGKIMRVYIGNSSGNRIDLTASSDLGAGKTIASKTTITIIVTWSNDLATRWEPGKTYYFKVALEVGAPFEFTEDAPS